MALSLASYAALSNLLIVFQFQILPITQERYPTHGDVVLIKYGSIQNVMNDHPVKGRAGSRSKTQKEKVETTAIA